MPEGAPRTSLVESWLTRITRRPLLTLLLCVGAAIAAGWAAATSLGVNSDTLAMLDEDLPFRKTDERLARAFPHLEDNLLAVIEAPTPEQATLAARRVADRLDAMPEVVRNWTWPEGSAFFTRNGLLFLPLPDLERLAERLTEAQPLLGRLATRTDAAALFGVLAQIAERGDAVPESFDSNRLYARIADALDASGTGSDRLLSWQRVLARADDAAGVARQVLIVRPELDHGKVLAGRDVMRAVDRMRRDLGLDGGEVRLYFTGSTALQYEEMRSVIDGAGLSAVLALILVTAVMLAGLRSVSLSLIALANLALGLVLTAGFAAVAIGRVNLISVTFVVLYIGLGVNYAVHVLLRFREIAQANATASTRALESRPASTQESTLESTISAGRFLCRPLALSAVTTALGFFAFVPTAFSGVAQLGLIAGVAMGITFALSYTALPAMLVLFRPRVAPTAPDHSAGWRRALEWPIEYRRTVLALGLLLAVAALPSVSGVRFDTDPLNVRDPASESVRTIRNLLDRGEGGYRNIQVLVAPDTEAGPQRRALERLPAVDRALSLDSFIPDDQSEKLFILEDLGWILGPAIVAADWNPDPLAPDALATAAGELADALAGADGDGAERLRRNLTALRARLDAGDRDAVATAVNRTLVGGMEPTLGRLSAGLRAERPVTRNDLPGWLVDQWLGAGGMQLIQVFPAVDTQRPEDRRAFVDQVASVAGDRATGGPVIQLAAAEAITSSFRQALIWAVVGIFAVLLFKLRDVAAALRVMAPLALGGLLTLAAMALLGVPFNFANVVALPLLLGVAVDNGIHLSERHRAGLLPDGNVLKTATARAIVVGAMITAGGFGNLAFSPHTGTATLGVVLAVGLGLMVVATLLFLPAMLGRERRIEAG